MANQQPVQPATRQPRLCPVVSPEFREALTPHAVGTRRAFSLGTPSTAEVRTSALWCPRRLRQITNGLIIVETYRTQLRKMQKQPCFVRHLFVLSETAYAGIQCDQPIMRPLVSKVSPEFPSTTEVRTIALWCPLRFVKLSKVSPEFAVTPGPARPSRQGEMRCLHHRGRSEDAAPPGARWTPRCHQ